MLMFTHRRTVLVFAYRRTDCVGVCTQENQPCWCSHTGGPTVLVFTHRRTNRVGVRTLEDGPCWCSHTPPLDFHGQQLLRAKQWMDGLVMASE